MKKFNGPLFIVGLSRSGTKLLRDLLNNHSQISIPDYETHFIPSLILANHEGFSLSKSIEIFKSSKFYSNYASSYNLNFDDFQKRTPKKDQDSKSFIEFILKRVVPKNAGTDFIWGDKTPKNLRYLNLLVSTFPGCKILHIIRDPRDRALSIKKTWWKSSIRASFLWNKEITEADEIGLSEEIYKEVSYEMLIENPGSVINGITNFLGIKYEDTMLDLKKPSEKYGVAAQKKGIVSVNSSKYLSMPKSEIKLIEGLCYPKMIEKGYPTVYATRKREISKLYLIILRIYDFVMFKLSVRIKGY